MMTERTKQKIPLVSIVAAIGVILIHSYDVPSYSTVDAGGRIVKFLETWISISLFGHASVSFFFMLSGYLFAHGLYTAKDWWEKLIRRVKSLIPPYLFWCFMGWLIFFVCSSIPQIGNHMNIKADISVNALFDTFVAIKYSHHLWYIQVLLVYCLLGIVLLYVSKKKGTSIVFFAILFMLSLLRFDLSWFRVLRFTSFSIGFLVEKWKPELINVNSKKISTISLVGLVCMSIIITFTNIPVLDRLCYFIFPIQMWFGFDLVFEKANKSMMINIAPYSFFIYCAHGILIDCIKEVVSMFGDSWITMLVSYFVSPAVILGGLLMMLFLLKKVSPKVLSVITGGRS